MRNRLEELRKARGIKQEELAAALEVSHQTIGALENGRYNPSILLAFKIARYFGLAIEEIFIYEEDDAKCRGKARAKTLEILRVGLRAGVVWAAAWDSSRHLAVLLFGILLLLSGVEFGCTLYYRRKM